MYRLGKTAARPDVPAFRLARFTAPAELPPDPPTFGHEGVIGPKGWYMFGNDKYGNCVWAGQAHGVMQWTREANAGVLFNTPGVLGDYAAYLRSIGVILNPNDPATDQGSDMQAAADYWRKTGIVDAKGKRHRIVAHLGLEPGNLQQIYHAVYLFGAVGLGLQLPASVFDQMKAGKPWSVVKGSPNEGGHYVWLNARRKEGLKVVSWGEEPLVEEPFIQEYCDEVRAYVSEEALINRKSPEGFDYDQLIVALTTLKSA